MFLVMRSLLVIFASVSGYFIVYEIAGNSLAYIGLVSGLLISVLALLFEDRVKRTPLRIVIGGAIGLIIGLVVAGHQKDGEPKQAKPQVLQPLVVDTSVIIDGRIAEVCETGFLEGTLVVPQFVLQELQYIADAGDPIKRARGKRGLDVLKQIQTNRKTTVEITDRDFPEIREVDSKLVALAKELSGRIITNDANLHKVAELHGVRVLNLNKLATAMKPVVLPGEVLNILVLKEGKEHGQGVGYLEDGTMVVIDNGREFVGKAIDVNITSVLQTTGGRMIFSKAKEDLKRAAYQ